MIFAPVMRRAAFAQAPRSTSADLALQRFLMGTLAAPAAARPSSQNAGFTATQDDKSTTLQLDVPGLAREHLTISIEGNVVSVNAIEGAPRKLQRAWELPADIDAAASSATLEHGVLTLTLARLEPVSKATTLTIQ